MPKTYSWLFVAVLLGIILVVILLSWKLFLPNKPSLPYISSGTTQVAPVGWPIGEFRPRYITTFRKDGSYYLQTIYRDKTGKIQTLNVFISGILGQEEVPFSILVDERGGVVELGSPADLAKHLKLGQRIKIDFLADAREDGSREATELCRRAKKVCAIASYVASDRETFKKFALDGVFPEGKLFPALGISLALE